MQIKSNKPTIKPVEKPKPVSTPVGPRLQLSIKSDKLRAGLTGGQSILLLGKPGVGKSSLTSKFPSPVYICDKLDTGITDLINNNRVSIPMEDVFVVSTFLELKTLLIELKSIFPQRRTVVIEGYVGLERLVMEEVCKVHCGDDWGPKGFGNWNVGHNTSAGRYLPELLTILSELKSIGFHIVITGHTVVKTQANPEGLGYESEFMHYNSKACMVVMQSWVQNILQYMYTVDTNIISGKSKAVGGNLKLVCHRSGQFEGKNKWGIVSPLAIEGLSPSEVYTTLCSSAKVSEDTFPAI